MRPRAPHVAPLAALLLTAAPVLSQVPQALPMGGTGPGTVPEETGLEYTVEVETSGFLSVVAQSEGGEDIRLVVTDAAGQPLPEGESDMDWGGDVGSEQLMVRIPRAGSYRVLVETLSWDSALIEIGGTFLPTEMAYLPPDPDGTPDAAKVLTVGQSYDDQVDPGSGDAWDWFAITPEQSGVLTVLTRSSEGDLVLEAYEKGAYMDYVDRSDEDQGGERGNETVTMDVTAGQTVYFKVAPLFGDEGPIGYRIASGIVPSM